MVRKEETIEESIFVETVYLGQVDNIHHHFCSITTKDSRTYEIHFLCIVLRNGVHEE